MSLTAILVPLSISVVISASESISEIVQKCKDKQKIANIPTKYVSCDLLVKTLTEHGIKVTVINERHVVCEFKNARMTFTKQHDEEPFVLEITGDYDTDDLVCTLETIQKEFNNNLQSYSYNNVMNNIPEGMHVASETIDDDNSIVITLNVD